MQDKRKFGRGPAKKRGEQFKIFSKDAPKVRAGEKARYRDPESPRFGARPAKPGAKPAIKVGGDDRPRFGAKRPPRDGDDRPRFGKGPRAEGDRPRFGAGRPSRDGDDRPRFGAKRPPRDGDDRPRFGKGPRAEGDRPRYGSSRPGSRPNKGSVWVKNSRREEEQEMAPGLPEAAPSVRKVRKEAVMTAFQEIWTLLFTTPVHLDSAISKQPGYLKSILAQIVAPILRTPSSLAESLGIGVPLGEPWSLKPEQLAQWRPARLMAERMYEAMAQGKIAPQPTREDFPPQMIAAWEKAWGTEATETLVTALAQEAPLGLRATRATSAQGLLKELAEGSQLPVAARVSDLSPMGVRLAGYAPVLGTELFKRGAFEIQDEGSQLMAFFTLWPDRYAPALTARPGSPASKPKALPEKSDPITVIDACAGAGGKSLALADGLNGKGRVYAYDTVPSKLQALRRRARHAGINNVQAVQVVEGQEAETVKKFRRRAQVVLVDAPCSGWGVLRRNPDIKWRQGSDTLQRMPELQRRILSEYADLVAPKGRLVFGVCTFRPEETREVVDAFLSEHPDFVAQEGGYLGPGPCDGFFMQAFTRKGNAG